MKKPIKIEHLFGDYLWTQDGVSNQRFFFVKPRMGRKQAKQALKSLERGKKQS